SKAILPCNFSLMHTLHQLPKSGDSDPSTFHLHKLHRKSISSENLQSPFLQLVPSKSLASLQVTLRKPSSELLAEQMVTNEINNKTSRTQFAKIFIFNVKT
ncbi:hypothetical protein Bhyg_07236, partial [Pseudolycoriella hygida]